MEIYLTLLQEIRKDVHDLDNLSEVWQKFETMQEKIHDVSSQVIETNVYEVKIETLEEDMRDFKTFLEKLDTKQDKMSIKLAGIVVAISILSSIITSLIASIITKYIK